jgi:hypothetical protein
MATAIMPAGQQQHFCGERDLQYAAFGRRLTKLHRKIALSQSTPTILVWLQE